MNHTGKIPVSQFSVVVPTATGEFPEAERVCHIVNRNAKRGRSKPNDELLYSSHENVIPMIINVLWLDFEHCWD